MKRLMLVLAIAVFLMVGCATTNEAWTKPGLTLERFQQDNSQCQMHARQIGQTIASGAGSTMADAVAGGLMGGMAARKAHKECMQSKGYYLVDKDTGERK